MAKSPQYDPQRHELYRMEKRGLFGLNKARLARKDHWTILDTTCRIFDVDRPRLRYEPATEWAGLYCSEPRPDIAMSTVDTGGLSAMTLLHELAHHVVSCADPLDTLEPHGPEFIGVYGDLLAYNGFMPHGSWYPLCREHGVRYWHTRSHDPASLMEALKKRAAKAAPKPPIRRS